jgi:hypothetical protein
MATPTAGCAVNSNASQPIRPKVDQMIAELHF